MVDLKIIKETDSEMYNALVKELKRQQNNIELIASENFVSPAVMAAAGTFLTNKYAEGLPGARYYGGCEFVDIAENLAIERAKQLFGAEHANVQPHSGCNANFIVYYALLKPGDNVLGMSLASGGHLTHGSKVSVSGKYFNFSSYGVNENGYIDYDEVERIAVETQPKLIVAGASAYPRAINFKRFREIADKVGAYLMVDMAHIAGLVATGLHESPIPYADVVTTTTHKTLRGPRGGLILCKADLGAKIDKAVFPGIQGGPLMHIIAAKGVAFKEALCPEFKDYQVQIIKNAQAMADQFIKNGVKLVSGGTDNHLMLLDLRGTGCTGKELQELLDECHITANKNAIPNDPESPKITSGLRVGTPAATSRGMNEDDMRVIADCITKVIFQKKAAKTEVKAAVKQLCSKYPLYKKDVRK